MKEDYLWDKTGAPDPEIERLENALAVFRYQKTDAPALPAKIIPFERKTPRNFFRLAFACGACAAIAVICFGVWLQSSSNKIEIAKDSMETIAPPVNRKAANEIPTKTPDNSFAGKAEFPKSTGEPKIIKVKKIVQPTERQNKIIARKVEGKKSEIKLTKEEKYAYDQLMLALSITSSKFKLVKDKVSGVEEEKNAVRQNAR